MTDKLALTIEDDPDLAEIYDQALRGAGYKTEIIYDGKAAQKRLGDVVPHLIVLDILLPGISGQDLLSQIRADKRLKGTIVLVATADTTMAEVCRDSADFVLVKPIFFSQLCDIASRLHDYHQSSNRIFL